MKKTVLFITRGAETSIFFVFLLAALFLGDGKQPFVDVFLASGILVLYVLLWREKKRITPLPKPVFLSWFGLICYFFVRSVFSDSIGYSVSATVRLIEAYLAFHLFYIAASERTIQSFFNGTILLALAATAASFIFLIFPSFTAFLPKMNLLFADYGHNHVADILVLAIPSSYFLFLEKKNTGTAALFVILLAGLVFSFARGAWVLLMGFFAIQSTIQIKRSTQPLHFVLPVVWSVFFAVCVFGSTLLSIKNYAATGGSIVGQIVKPAAWNDQRFVYWKQALLAIRERPFFGSGPGTFYLQSRRLQDAPLSYSWFAHSFLLQGLAELGIFGVLPFIALLFYSYRSAIAGIIKNPHQSVYWKSLFWGTALSLVYSFYEFNLDFAVVWLLFWAMLGILNGQLNKEANVQMKSGLQPMPTAGLILLLIFYLSQIGGSLAGALRLKPEIIFYLLPYQKNIATDYLESQKFTASPVSPSVKKAAEKMYKGDPDILFDLAENEPTPLRAQAYFAKAVRADSTNKTFHEKYFRHMVDHDTYAGMSDELVLFVEKFLPKQYDPVDIQQAIFSASFSQEMNLQLASIAPHIFDYPPSRSKLFYLLGLYIAPQSPAAAASLLGGARDISPLWSYYHLELASAQKYLLKDVEGARKTIEQCTKISKTASHCSFFMTNPLLPPWTFKKSILDIRDR